MNMNKIIVLLIGSLLLSACDVTDSIIDSANSSLKQKDMRQSLERDKQEHQTKQAKIIEKIKRSVQYDLISNAEKKFIEQNHMYDEILLQESHIGDYQEIAEFNFGYPVEIRFATTRSILGVKNIYQFQGHMYYSSEGEFKKITWKFIGETTDASELRRNAETIGKIYENLKEKE